MTQRFTLRNVLIGLLTVAMLGTSLPWPAQGAWKTEEVPVFVFEDGVPASFTTDSESTLAISDQRFKDGKSSLKWDFGSASSLTVSHPIGFKSAYKDTFGVWVYNEEPTEDKLTFSFGHGGITDAWFNFGLNFSGWRTAWVPYNDMEGTATPEMDTLVVTAPNTSGTIYFDQMILSNPVDVRHPTRDVQVPFVNPDADTSPSAHWQAVLKFDQLLPGEAEEESESDDIGDMLDLLEERYVDFVFSPVSVTEESMLALRDEFQSYAIAREGEAVSGRPVNLVHIKDIYPKAIAKDMKALVNEVNVRAYTDFMLDVAKAYHSIDDSALRSELEQMFITLSLHLKDQGWAWGSSLGTIHHLGYNIRGLYPSLLLMEDALEEAELLSWAQEMMGWYSGIGRIFEPLDESYANIDILNTTLQGMLASILILDEEDRQAVLLKRLSEWLSDGLLPAPGLMPSLKPDGSGFHHMGFYPAYTKGAFNGMTPVVYMLSGTPYRISQEAHETLKKAVLAMRLYSNKYEWLVSVAGRHPTGKQKITSYAFKYLALSGTPDGSEPIDPEVAAAYLRLVEPERVDETTALLQEMGYEAEPDPNGHWTMNYGTLALHRRDHWLVGVRGHNRYFWAGELYSNANWYGRYTTYGQIEIMNQGEPVNHGDSGFSHDGWDWNRWPGTTTIHLPMDELKGKSFTEMLLTDETYAGGLNIEGKNGMFAMKLHEHPKYDESHRARKSVFMFDDRIIALGSNIENTDEAHRTETTLFQNHLASENDPLWIGAMNPLTAFPYQDQLALTEAMWIVDNKENGYYIPAGQTIGIHKQTQQSKDQKKGKDTSGSFATAWIDHGTAPKDATYEYAIVVGATEGRMHAFSKLMEKPDQAPYTVLQQDRDAHIVKDRATKTIGYALFEAGNQIGHGYLAAADTPSMVMIKEKGNQLVLSAVDPDLRFYEGRDEDQYDENGNFVGGVGPYDRPWRENESEMHTMKLTIRGQWELKTSDAAYRIVASDQDYTILELDAKDAAPIELELKPLK
jgi:chondroitin-sulfate-ABC endolyase/exolyase